MRWGYSVVNVFGIRDTKRHKGAHTEQSSQWAKEHMDYLVSKGVAATLVKGGKGEAPYISYNLKEAQEKGVINN